MDDYETLTFLNSQLNDMMRLIEILRKRYPKHENVLGYLDALEEFNDGYIIWTSTCINTFGPIMGQNFKFVPNELKFDALVWSLKMI
jgi:hypothetical protein